MVDATGRHGATIVLEQRFTFMLTPPLIVEASVCDVTGQVQSLRFGETLTLYASIESERSLEILQASMSQLGWSVNAPKLVDSTVLEDHPVDCLASNATSLTPNQYLVGFRLRLDGSFIDGGGQIMLTVRDIDGLSSSLMIPIDFFHAAPSLTMEAITNATAGDRIEPIAYVHDLDGLSDVECLAVVSNNGTALANFSLEAQMEGTSQTNASLSFVFPTTPALGNSTLRFNFSCQDGWGQTASVWSETTIAPKPPCIDCALSDVETTEADVLSQIGPWLFGLIVALAIVALGVTVQVKRGSTETTAPLWSHDDDESTAASPEALPLTMLEGSEIPAGWSAEAYLEWLTGPAPDGWSDLQWDAFSGEQMPFFEHLMVDEIEKS